MPTNIFYKNKPSTPERFFTNRCDTMFKNGNEPTRPITNINKYANHNLNLLNVENTGDNNNRNGIISYLHCHGGEDLGQFSVPPNIKIVTFYRFGPSTFGDPTLAGYFKKIANLYSKEDKIEELKLKFFFIRKNFNPGNKDDIRNFMNEDFQIDIKEHPPCSIMTDQIISFHNDTPIDKRNMGLIRLYPNIEGSDELKYDGNDFDLIGQTVDGKKIEFLDNTNSPEYNKHLIISYPNINGLAYRLRDFVYMISNNLNIYQPNQILTIFFAICRPNEDLLQIPLLRQVSEGIMEDIRIEKDITGSIQPLETASDEEKELEIIELNEIKNIGIRDFLKTKVSGYSKISRIKKETIQREIDYIPLEINNDIYDIFIKIIYFEGIRTPSKSFASNLEALNNKKSTYSDQEEIRRVEEKIIQKKESRKLFGKKLAANLSAKS